MGGWRVFRNWTTGLRGEYPHLRCLPYHQDVNAVLEKSFFSLVGTTLSPLSPAFMGAREVRGHEGGKKRNDISSNKGLRRSCSSSCIRSSTTISSRIRSARPASAIVPRQFTYHPLGRRRWSLQDAGGLHPPKFLAICGRAWADAQCPFASQGRGAPSWNLSDIVKLMKKDPLKVVIMAGAGISTPSGIPDFRTPGTGLYDNLQQYNIPYPEAIFDINFFQENPKPFMTLAKELWPAEKYHPNYIHFFVKLLDKKGKLLRMYTQNIDGLERLCGLSPKKLVEAHGTFSSATCLGCGKSYSGENLEIVKNVVLEGVNIPRCEENCGGIVKPDIVFFGEALPKKFFQYFTDFPRADLLLVMGTSLEVEPFASIVNASKVSTPRLLINRDAVGPWITKRCMRTGDVCVEGDLIKNVKNLVQMLGWDKEIDELIQSYWSNHGDGGPLPPHMASSSKSNQGNATHESTEMDQSFNHQETLPSLTTVPSSTTHRHSPDAVEENVIKETRETTPPQEGRVEVIEDSRSIKFAQRVKVDLESYVHSGAQITAEFSSMLLSDNDSGSVESMAKSSPERSTSNDAATNTLPKMTNEASDNCLIGPQARRPDPTIMHREYATVSLDLLSCDIKSSSASSASSNSSTETDIRDYESSSKSSDKFPTVTSTKYVWKNQVAAVKSVAASPQLSSPPEKASFQVTKGFFQPKLEKALSARGRAVQLSPVRGVKGVGFVLRPPKHFVVLDKREERTAVW